MNHTKKVLEGIDASFDKKFDGGYDLDTPTMDNPSAGSEIAHYNELKSFLHTIAKELIEAVREDVGMLEKEYCKEDILQEKNKPYDWHGFSHALSTIDKGLGEIQQKL